MASTGTTSTAVLVTNVTCNGTGTVVWTFDHTVDVVTLIDDFIVAGEQATSFDAQAGMTITLSYPTAKFPGDGWDLLAAGVDVTFIPAGTLADQSGTST